MNLFLGQLIIRVVKDPRREERKGFPLLRYWHHCRAPHGGTLLRPRLLQLRALGPLRSMGRKQEFWPGPSSGSLPAGSSGNKSGTSPFLFLNLNLQEKIFEWIDSLVLVTLVKICYEYSCFVLIPFLPEMVSVLLCLCLLCHLSYREKP